jgi:8-oxo-dGTP diphosphatase
MPKSDQGVSRTRYAVIPRTLIFITRNKTVLLLKGAPNKRIWANKYNGIGGHIEKGEDYLSSARRELYEETGFTIDQLQLCGIVMIDAEEDLGISVFILKGGCEKGEPISSQEGILEWIPIDEINKYPLVEDLPIILPRILAMGINDPPFSARYAYNQKDKLMIRFES